VLSKMRAANVRLTSVASVTAGLQDKGYWEGAKDSKFSFPATLGPLSVAPAPKLKVQMEKAGRAYSVELSGPLAVLAKLEFSKVGRCSPKSPCPQYWPGAPERVASICWAYPMEGMAQLERRSRLAFLAVTSSVELCFVAFGGYLLLDGRGEVIGVQAIVQGESHPDQLVFREPRSWRKEFTETLASDGRFQPVTLPSLLRTGAKEFCWINPGEELVSGTERWAPSEHGSFLYMMGGEHPHVYYPMADPAEMKKSKFNVADQPAGALVPSTNTYYRENKNAMETALSEAVHSAISAKAPQPVRFMGNTLLEIADRTKK